MALVAVVVAAAVVRGLIVFFQSFLSSCGKLTFSNWKYANTVCAVKGFQQPEL